MTTAPRTRLEDGSEDIAEGPNNVVFSGYIEAKEEKGKKEKRSLSKASNSFLSQER